MKKFIALTLALVLVLSLAACGGDKASSDTVRIALTAPLTGNLSQYGESFKNSVELAAKQWNEKGGVLGKKIELVVEDEDDGYENIVRDENLVISDEELAKSGFGMEDENGDPIRDQIEFDFEEVFEEELGEDEDERFPERQ